MSVATVMPAAPVKKPGTRPQPQHQEEERPAPPKDFEEFLNLLSLTGVLLGGVWRALENRVRMVIGEKQYCPLTAVAEIVTGKYFETNNYDKAWKAMGKPNFDPVKVVRAADIRTLQCPELRIQLLRSCGVEES